MTRPISASIHRKLKLQMFMHLWKIYYVQKFIKMHMTYRHKIFKERYYFMIFKKNEINLYFIFYFYSYIHKNLNLHKHSSIHNLIKFQYFYINF